MFTHYTPAPVNRWRLVLFPEHAEMLKEDPETFVLGQRMRLWLGRQRQTKARAIRDRWYGRPTWKRSRTQYPAVQPSTLPVAPSFSPSFASFPGSFFLFSPSWLRRKAKGTVFILYPLVLIIHKGSKSCINDWRISHLSHLPGFDWWVSIQGYSYSSCINYS